MLPPAFFRWNSSIVTFWRRNLPTSPQDPQNLSAIGYLGRLSLAVEVEADGLFGKEVAIRPPASYKMY